MLLSPFKKAENRAVVSTLPALFFKKAAFPRDLKTRESGLLPHYRG